MGHIDRIVGSSYSINIGLCIINIRSAHKVIRGERTRAFHCHDAPFDFVNEP
jgi:hypothetical protein